MSLRAAIMIASLAGLVAPARAYVLTRTSSGTPVHWPTRCLVFAPDARGDESEDEIDIDAIDATLARAAANWNSRMSACTPMQIGVVPATRALESVSDGRPSVVFRAQTWGRANKKYDPSAIAVTTVWFADRPDDPADGQISDADIELNAVNYTFTTSPMTAVARPDTRVADLENTLTHELGHALGLAHTCWDHKTDDPPPDETGAPAPDCDSSMLPMKVTSATMFPYSDERATNMRFVGDDDVQGVCDSYPPETAPTACYSYIEGAGCALPASPATGGLILGGLALALAIGGRRRRDRI